VPFPVMPAKAGTQAGRTVPEGLGSRFRGNDEFRAKEFLDATFAVRSLRGNDGIGLRILGFFPDEL